MALATLFNMMETPFGALWAWIGVSEVPAATLSGGAIVLASVIGRLVLDRKRWG